MLTMALSLVQLPLTTGSCEEAVSPLRDEEDGISEPMNAG